MITDYGFVLARGDKGFSKIFPNGWQDRYKSVITLIEFVGGC